MKYRKKPVVIDAVQFDGEDCIPLTDFIGSYGSEQNPHNQALLSDGKTVKITTLEGDMVISKGDYLIRGVKGEYYPCKPDIFEQTYEKV